MTEFKDTDMWAATDVVVDMGTDDDAAHLEVFIGTGYLTPKLVWDQREHWFKYIEDSKEKWNNMDTDRREAAKRLVLTALERMYDNVDEWLPESFESGGGDFIDSRIRIIFTDIEREADRFEEATSFQIKKAEQETARIFGMKLEEEESV